ncbi:MAG: terpene cyclase/mutase family protein [Fuerstiella sp.]|nr:terpene cyclase/mutase family protein [Fuerstiella sp.]MCP4856671.1 terpene cyclase/mutase family protein [Fuerstiella sp.]
MTVLNMVLQKVWRGGQLNGDDIVALCLLLAMVASLSHLFTMLVTRWGDRHIAVKSLLASLMVHAVCLLGLEVFDPLDPTRTAAAAEAYAPPEIVTQILVESEDTVSLRESGNTPVPDQPTAPDTELARLPQQARLMDAPDSPDREQEQLDSLKTQAEDVSQFEQSLTPESAVRVDAGMEAPRVAAANDPAAELRTMLEQSKADVYVQDKERVQTKRGDTTANDAPQERQMSAGSVNRIDTNIVVEDTSVSTTSTNQQSSISLPQAPDADVARNKAAPLTGTDPLEVAGLSLNQPRNRTSMARSFESRLPRPSRTLPSMNPGQRPVRQNSLMPQTPIPLSSEYDEVRIGTSSDILTDALRSAATLVDPDVHSIRRRDSRPATYVLRNLEQRREAAARFGGTVESEAAVELSLKWLSAMQSADGHWDAETHGAGQVSVDENGVPRDNAGRDSDAGITALVTLSFLGAGYTHENGKYAISVDKALGWLIDQQGSDGSLAGGARHYAKMYCHAMATYALAEALGMQTDVLVGPIVDPIIPAAGPYAAHQIAASLMLQQGLSPHMAAATANSLVYTNADAVAYGLRKVDELRLRTALLKAVTYTISQQDPKSGGWRYRFGQEGDVSMFGWQMMSLKSAAIAGVSIDPTVRQRMIRFLDSVRQGNHGGLFGYRRSVIIDGQETERVTPVMTAEALFCQQMLGNPRESLASREAVQYLLRNRPQLSQLNMYYWYYGTLAMYQYGGQPWEEWNSVVRDTLISQQRHDGQFAGSWDPNGPWGRYGGRLYSTAISTMTLEVYYRLLPLYRMNEHGDK